VVFSSLLFLFRFLPLALAGHLLVPRRWRNAALLLASLFFYAWGEGAVVLVMVASIAVNWGAGHVINKCDDRIRRQLWVALSVAFNLALLCVFKYLGFFVDTLNALLWRLDSPILHVKAIGLPIGISFFTFQAMSYVIDIYRGDARPQKNPLDFGLYIALFPQLIAGPIVRYRDLASQLAQRTVDISGFAHGARRFIMGLAKKVLIANELARASEYAFHQSPSSELSVGLAWIGLVAYGLQIYFDFSGYSDMAIGAGRMFGFRLRENFLHPYASCSLTEFWRRWHISLSSWFRDYLYLPLGGNRCGALRTYRNLLIVFLLCGLWHGANWTFLVWGLWHGAFLIAERVVRARPGLRALAERVPRPASHAYLLLVVLLGWVPFESSNLGAAWDYVACLFGAGTASAPRWTAEMVLDPLLLTVLLAGALGSLPILPRLRALHCTLASRGGASRGMALALDLCGHACLALMAVLAVASLAGGTHDPFIYFRF